jgi:DNA-binding transcriptional ArsR family regulator
MFAPPASPSGEVGGGPEPGTDPLWVEDEMRPATDTAHPVRLDDEALEAVAGALRALADPTRIRLIAELDARGPEGVGALAASLPISRQAVSRQLSVLHAAGVVRRRREGMRVVYELRDHTGLWLVGQLAETFAPAAS